MIARADGWATPLTTIWPGLMMPGLVGGDQLHGVAQDLHVIQTDAGEHGHPRRQHVGGIDPAAQPHLHHGRVHLLLGEQAEGQGHQRLEVGGRTPRRLPACLVQRRLHPMIPQAHQRCSGRHPAADLKALIQDLQMGRQVQAGAIARGRQNGGGHGRRRPLARGSAHVNRRERPAAGRPAAPECARCAPAPRRGRRGAQRCLPRKSSRPSRRWYSARISLRSMGSDYTTLRVRGERGSRKRRGCVPR